MRGPIGVCGANALWRFPLPVEPPHCPVHLLYVALPLLLGFFVGFSPLKLLLSLQLVITLQSVGLQSAGLECPPNRASRFTCVTAIPESAALGQALHFTKHTLEPLLNLPELQLPQPRSVDNHRPRNKEKQFSPGCCMPPPTVAFPHHLRALPLRSQKPIHQRRLSHSRTSQQNNRLPGYQICIQPTQACSCLRADAINAYSYKIAAQPFGNFLRFLANVGLVQQHHRSCSTLPNLHQESFETPQIEVAIQAHH